MRTPRRPGNDDADLPSGDGEVINRAESLNKSGRRTARKPLDYSPQREQSIAHDDLAGTIAHLGSDLPDPSPQKDDVRAMELPSHGTRSIARTIAMEDPLRMPDPARARTSHGGWDTALSVSPLEPQANKALGPSNGRLTRFSASGPNPAYRKPVKTTFTTTRLVTGGHQARPDIYDLEDSPEAPTSRLRAKRVEHARAISPTRKLRKAASNRLIHGAAVPLHGTLLASPHQQADVHSLSPELPQPENEQIAASPRRSTRRTAVAQQVLEQAQAETVEKASTDDTLFMDRFPDRPASETSEVDQASQQQRDAQPAEEAESDRVLEARCGAEIDVLARQADIAGEKVFSPPKPQRGLRNRPRKTSPVATTSRSVAAVVIPVQDKPISQPPLFLSEVTEPIVSERSQMRTKKKPNQAKTAKRYARSNAGRRSAGMLPGQDLHEEGEHAADREDEGGEQAEPERTRAVEESEEAAEEDGKDLDSDFQRQAPIEKPVRIRPSDLYTRDSHDDQSDGDGSQWEGRSSSNDILASRKRPRNSARERRAGGASQKRPKRDLGAQTASADTPETVSEADQARLYGQFPALRGVCKSLERVGVQTLGGSPQPQCIIRLKDEKVIAAVNLSKSVLTKLENMEDPRSDLIDAAGAVDALYHNSGGNEPQLDNVVRIKNIYFHLFPQLVRMVYRMLLAYEESDAGKELGSPLTSEHLRLVRTMIKVVLDLADGAKKYVRPPSRLCLVQPVDNGVVAPLKVVYKAFTTAHTQLERAAVHRRQHQLVAQRDALAAEREEKEERHAQHFKKIKQKWQQLHFERVCAEDCIMSLQKRNHLRCIPFPEAEFDDNGNVFERVEIFRPRIGPTPAAVERARAFAWPEECLVALADGLKQYAGLDVFEKVFRRYCGRNGLLHHYNVTEIVVCAADMKPWLLQQEVGLEDWVTTVPVWTKEHPLGKENEVAEEGDGGGSHDT
ncbi:hypothetical protein LTR91_011599 [Friedmanniomyces endolithicus]|uniref:Uncharacterized protein n=1 Tax=Friedmanniomyces endolithicus TaxID=329885 RepID=A0AAN6QRS4_9PEZI|nr:hypothetical protein LTR57_013222 [Friedmanniomyces endolithicus]KAK0982351.1 hypothetical protein LTR91_011599 [Friedmanniomyces endolithicus]KAK0996243.1 hypothetical protein LTS01_006508 [Friedmanniomyces endolithicus]KAK1039216.1 hypothetical protein LTS16_011361 [Friedmanniomyces endolithicus]